MQDRSPSSFPISNFVLFVALSFAILVGYQLLMARLHPRPAMPPEVAQQEEGKPAPAAKKPAAEKPAAEKPLAEKPAAKAPAAPLPAAKPAGQPKPEPAIPRQWITLGSAEPNNPCRMLVTLSNQGAAVARIELSSSRYRHLMAKEPELGPEAKDFLEVRNGYLGHVAMLDDLKGNGCPVQVVGAGTPAAEAGLRPGDRITALDDHGISSAGDLREALARTKPKQKVQLTVKRDGKELKLPVTLGVEPLEVVRPEGSDPLSLLGTLQQVDDERIAEEEPGDDVQLAKELPGVDLRGANWQLVRSDQHQAVFRRTLAKEGLEITKTYSLEPVPIDSLADADYPAYDLKFDIEIRNTSTSGKTHKVAYRLDGPNGLPTEGWWYAYKVARGTWGSAGLRDVVVGLPHKSEPSMITCSEIADGKTGAGWQDEPLAYLAVDAQYFSAALIPQEETVNHIARAIALRVGPVNAERKTLTNTSFRIQSKAVDLPAGKSLTDHFVLFAGPKKPLLLEKYDLDELVYYGWFGWVAAPMLKVLHGFYFVFRNYGIAIILLTVLVRLAMFPLGRKQAMNAQKMQELQPEIKKIQEKYKKDMEARTKAQQELFRKHNYNPLSGCLVVFIQLPIFMGLYRSLMVDVELRDAPLISSAIRWCSNLAAPDMLCNWSWFMPAWVNSGAGIFGLGPYFNILPVFTIVLFILQQKMFMPPAADEQAAMQQKIMKYMMVFMGLMFFKVASGLCLYFIASSLWGLAERKLLPKTAAAGAGGSEPGPRVPRPSRPDRNGGAGRRKNRGKR